MSSSDPPEGQPGPSSPSEAGASAEGSPAEPPRASGSEPARSEEHRGAKDGGRGRLGLVIGGILGAVVLAIALRGHDEADEPAAPPAPPGQPPPPTPSAPQEHPAPVAPAEPEHSKIPACETVLTFMEKKRADHHCQTVNGDFAKVLCEAPHSERPTCVPKFDAMFACIRALPETVWTCQEGELTLDQSSCQRQVKTFMTCLQAP